MEIKEFRNALLANIKNELKDLALIQRNLKKSRKLEFRPKNKSLQSICNEIENNAYNIEFILNRYFWLKHGKKYFTNRGINDYWEYVVSNYNNFDYEDSLRNKEVSWSTIYSEELKKYIPTPYKTFEEYMKYVMKVFIENKAKQYNLELPQDITVLINKF